MVAARKYRLADTFVLLDCGELGQMSVRVTGESSLALGERVGLQFDTEHIHYFDQAGESVF